FPVRFMCSPPNKATPAVAFSAVTPAKVPAGLPALVPIEIVMRSVESIPVVTTLPFLSSIATLKVGNPAFTGVETGWTRKANCVGDPATRVYLKRLVPLSVPPEVLGTETEALYGPDTVGLVRFFRVTVIVLFPLTPT